MQIQPQEKAASRPPALPQPPRDEVSPLHGCNVNLVALDWPMVLLQPRFVVLPGTEGMAGYRSYWLPFRGFLIGIPITLGMSLVLALIAVGIASN